MTTVFWVLVGLEIEQEGYEPPPKIIFWGLRYFEVLGGRATALEVAVSPRGTWYFLVHKL